MGGPGPSFTKEELPCIHVMLNDGHTGGREWVWKGQILVIPAETWQGCGPAVVDIGLMPSSDCAKVLPVNNQNSLDLRMWLFPLKTKIFPLLTELLVGCWHFAAGLPWVQCIWLTIEWPFETQPIPKLGTTCL